MTFVPPRDASGRPKSTIITELDSCIEADAAYTCSTQFVTIATTNETAILLCKYPSSLATSGKMRSFCIGLNSTTTRAIIRFYKNPTITADGSAISRENSHFKSSQSTANMTMFKSPNISANGTFLNMLLYRANSSTNFFNKEYVLDSGHNLLITIQNNETSKDVHVDVDWLEL